MADTLIQIFGKIDATKDKHGRSVVELFRKLPSKREYPEYYTIIQQPMDLNTIKNHVQSSKYSSLAHFQGDVDLMVKNAHTFNEAGSEVYEDATRIQKVAHAEITKSHRSVLAACFNQVVSTLTSVRDKKGRDLCEMFATLPTPAEMPEYYSVIKTPMDFDTINSKIHSSKYSTLESLEADLMLMFDNAMTFNQESSQIYHDAVSLRKLIPAEIAKARDMLSQSEWAYLMPTGITSSTLELAVKTANDHSSRVQSHRVKQEDTSTSEPPLPLKKQLKIAKDSPSHPDMPLITPVKRTADSASTKDPVAVDSPVSAKRPKTVDAPTTPADSAPIPKLVLKKSTPAAADAAQLSSTEGLSLKVKVKVPKDLPSTSTTASKTPTESTDPALDSEEAMQLAVIDRVLAYQDRHDQHFLYEPFETLPSKKEYPDYYEIIKLPISLAMIRKRIKSKEYPDLLALQTDFDLMFENAIKYNEVGSAIHKDASLLKRAVREKVRGLMMSVERKDSTIGSATVESASPASPPTKRNDSKLKESDRKIGRLSRMSPEYDADSNADSVPAPASSRKRPNSHQKQMVEEMSDSATTTPLRLTAAPVKEQAGTPGTVSLSSAMWAVYHAITSITDPDDSSYQLCEPFMKLPNRRDYSDYYRIISDPIDLRTIRKRILEGSYASLTSLYADIRLLFNNAMTYNEEHSDIYDSAVLLLKEATHEMSRQRKLVDASQSNDSELKLQIKLTEHGPVAAQHGSQSNDNKQGSLSVKVLIPDHDKQYHARFQFV
jgi:protein polybromo-1